MKNLLIFILAIVFSALSYAAEIPSSPRVEKAIKSVQPDLQKALQAKGLKYGSPIFIRMFKSTNKLEVWVQKQNSFTLFKTYDICTYSGNLGPKTKQGDNQAPEGFYAVRPDSLNPWSSYHMSFNLGYPNAYDKAQGYTGSALMVHGNCVSIGCYAMGDENIEEIYALAVGAFKGGQSFFRVHIFPFELEDETLNQFKDHRWYPFWKDLKPGYDYFNQHQVPPNIVVKNKRYQLD